jgi:glucan phosphorylase
MAMVQPLLQVTDIFLLSSNTQTCYLLLSPTATEDGRQVFKWAAGEQVTAAAYDNPIPGFGTRNCINLRLWAAKPSKEFDLEAFNTG